MWTKRGNDYPVADMSGSSNNDRLWLKIFGEMVYYSFKEGGDARAYCVW